MAERNLAKPTLAVSLLLAVGVAILLAAPTPKSNPKGVTYYIDATQGSDIGRGTSPATAWKTLAKVNATTFVPGERILFKSGGVWTGQLWPKGSGSEQYPIVIDKYGGEARPVIHGHGEADAAVLLKNQQYWEINNLEVTNTSSKPAVRRGVRLVAENAGDLHHLYVRGFYVHDVNGSDEEKENGGITYACIGVSKPSRFIDLRIEGNRISHVDRSGIFGWSTHWMRSKWYPSLGVIIRKNVLDDIGGDGIVPVATDGAIVEYNVVGHANQRSQGYNVGIWPWSADNTTVQFNEVYRTGGQRDGEGFDSDWNSRNTVIQYNYSHDNDGGFLLICNEGGHDPSENIGNTGTIVRYNISQNDHNRGITIAGPVTNSTIYNNTIFVGKGEKVSLLLHADWAGWATGTYLYNNIFLVEGSAQFAYGVSRADDGAYTTAPGLGQSKDTVFDFNVYFGNLVAAQDPHAITRDPRLLKPGSAGVGRDTTSGYGPRPGSPAINSGWIVPNNGGKDFRGTKVPSCGASDRGAIESVRCATSQLLSSCHFYGVQPLKEAILRFKEALACAGS